MSLNAGLTTIHEDDIARTLEENRRLADGQTTQHFENRWRHRDGAFADDHVVCASGHCLEVIAVVPGDRKSHRLQNRSRIGGGDGQGGLAFTRLQRLQKLANLPRT